MTINKQYLVVIGLGELPDMFRSSRRYMIVVFMRRYSDDVSKMRQLLC